MDLNNILAAIQLGKFNLSELATLIETIQNSVDDDLSSLDHDDPRQVINVRALQGVVKQLTDPATLLRRVHGRTGL